MINERTWAEIDLNAISSNIKTIRKKTGAGVATMAVVKADGYGHGAVEIARTSLESGAGYLGVATCDEGIELRESGIGGHILVLGHTPCAMLAEAVRHDLSLTVFDGETAERLSKISEVSEKKHNIHIKLDTGMNRLGFDPTDKSAGVIEKISGLPGVFIEGIFTHFAHADCPDLSFTYEQNDVFNRFAESLKKRGIHIPMQHAANSAAALYSNDFYHSMIRLGIALYGLYPSYTKGFGDYEMQPALSLKSKISRVKKISPGETVGYGRTYRADCDIFAATVPIGYADGYSRALSGKAEVLIHGERAKIIGRICMDQLMVDVTDIIKKTCVKPGDTVTLIGEDGGSRILTADLAKLQGTIDHEIVCGIGKRIPRIYK